MNNFLFNIHILILVLFSLSGCSDSYESGLTGTISSTGYSLTAILSKAENGPSNDVFNKNSDELHIRIENASIDTYVCLGIKVDCNLYNPLSSEDSSNPWAKLYHGQTTKGMTTPWIYDSDLKIWKNFLILNQISQDVLGAHTLHVYNHSSGDNCSATFLLTSSP